MTVPVVFATCATVGSLTKVPAGGASPLHTGGTIVPTQPSPTRHWTEGWTELVALEQAVWKTGTQALSGLTLKHDMLVPLLLKAVRAETISLDRYTRMMNLLRFGADLFIDQEYLLRELPARVYRRNYPTAYDNKVAVTLAIASRVKAGRTMKLGNFKVSEFKDIPVAQAIIFPLGAVVKPNQRGEVEKHRGTR